MKRRLANVGTDFVDMNEKLYLEISLRCWSFCFLQKLKKRALGLIKAQLRKNGNG